MESLNSNYEQLMKKASDILVLYSVQYLLHWDMETKMPPRGINLRSQQLGTLSQILHQKSTDPEIEKLLQKIEEHPDFESLDLVKKRNVELIRKYYNEQAKLPEELVVKTAKQQAITIDVWRKAKAAKDFKMFKPELEKLFDLRKQAAEIWMEVKKTATPYDALIDYFEPKMSSELIAKTFDKLKPDLMSIIEKCVNSPKQPDVSILKRRVPLNIQYEISKSIARFVGYDIESSNAGGRIDETEHPFTTGYFDDVRITTHYYEDDFASSLFSVLHECGHALYDQNLNREWMYQFVGMSCSYGFHESQSRFIENIVGRSREFWTYYLPRLKELSGSIFADVDLDKFVHAINKVAPSKIRVEADEVTYCLHIIVRFEIERALFAGEVSVAELPEVWNRKYMDYLGVKIENDSEGVMQDIHWSSGYFGYFPSYALGNIYSGQILSVLEREMPAWKEEIAEGNFQNVKEWLMKNVYAYGNLYDPADLLKLITGEEINPKYFINYLNNKYSKLYGY